MAKVKLIMYRHGMPHSFGFSSVGEAVDNALSQLDHDVAYPHCIEVDGKRIWQQPGPSNVRESLQDLREGKFSP